MTIVVSRVYEGVGDFCLQERYKNILSRLTRGLILKEYIYEYVFGCNRLEAIFWFLIIGNQLNLN